MDHLDQDVGRRSEAAARALAAQRRCAETIARMTVAGLLILPAPFFWAPPLWVAALVGRRPAGESGVAAEVIELVTPTAAANDNAVPLLEDRAIRYCG